MALLVAVSLALLACANAGSMQMFQQQQQPQQYQMPVGNNGCQQGADGMMPAGCEIPAMTADNLEEYLEQQMQAQQYETQQMQEKIKAQFEEMVQEVTRKKHRYVMSLTSEFVSACECSRVSASISASYLQVAQQLNITEPDDLWDATRLPYQATSEEDARGLIFVGLINTMCDSVRAFNTFAEQVEQRIPFFVQGKKK